MTFANHSILEMDVQHENRISMLERGLSQLEDLIWILQERLLKLEQLKLSQLADRMSRAHRAINQLEERTPGYDGGILALQEMIESANKDIFFWKRWVQLFIVVSLVLFVMFVYSIWCVQSLKEATLDAFVKMEGITEEVLEEHMQKMEHERKIKKDHLGDEQTHGSFMSESAASILNKDVPRFEEKSWTRDRMEKVQEDDLEEEQRHAEHMTSSLTTLLNANVPRSDSMDGARNMTEVVQEHIQDMEHKEKVEEDSLESDQKPGEGMNPSLTSTSSNNVSEFHGMDGIRHRTPEPERE